MSTRGFIGIYNSDTNTVTGIYNHYDSYPEYTGVLLAGFYRTPEAVRALIAEGDASQLGTEIGTKHSFRDDTEYTESGFARQCTFYARDRGETGTQAREFTSWPEVQETHSWADYYYVFSQGQWWVNNRSGEWQSLAHILAQVTAQTHTEQVPA